MHCSRSDNLRIRRQDVTDEINARAKTNLRLLRVLLRPTDESIFIGLSVAGESIDLRVRSQSAFIINVTATNSPDTHRVHWLTSVLYFGHVSKKARWLSRIANVSELGDSLVKTAPLHMLSNQTASAPWFFSEGLKLPYKTYITFH